MRTRWNHIITIGAIIGTIVSVIIVAKGPPPVISGTGQVANVWFATNGSSTGIDCAWHLTAIPNPNPLGTSLCGPVTSGAADANGAWNQAYLKVPAGATGVIGAVCGNYPSQKVIYSSTNNNPNVTFQQNASCNTQVGHYCDLACYNGLGPNFQISDGIVLYGVSNVTIKGTASTFTAGEFVSHSDFAGNCCSYPNGTHFPANNHVDGIAFNTGAAADFNNVTITNAVMGNYPDLDPPNGACPVQGSPSGNASCPNAGTLNGNPTGYWCPNSGVSPGNGSEYAPPFTTPGDGIRLTNSHVNLATVNAPPTDIFQITNTILQHYNLPSGTGNRDPVTGCPIFQAHTAFFYLNWIPDFLFSGNKCFDVSYACIEQDLGNAGTDVCQNNTIENSWFPPVSQAILYKTQSTATCGGLVIRYNSCQTTCGTIYSATNAPGHYTNSKFYGNAQGSNTACPYYLNGSGSPITDVSGWTINNNYRTTGSSCSGETNSITNATNPYVDSANFDLHSISTFAGLASGDPANCPTTDIDNQTRPIPFATTCDIGSDER